MENENFDEVLKSHIEQVFENYDDSQANEGWNLLRKKYPAKKRRDYFFWWISSAAVLVFVALLCWFFQPDIYRATVVKSIKQPNADSAKKAVRFHLSFENSIVKIDSFNVKQIKKTLLKTASNFTFKQKVIQQKTPTIIQKNIRINQKFKLNNTIFTDKKLVSTDSLNHQTQVSDLAKADSIQPEKSPVIAPIQNPIIKPVTKKDPIKTASAKKALSKPSKFGLSIYAGPLVNFANGSNNQLGFGAGISTDFQLSKKLKLSSGLSLIQNKLIYKDNFNNSLLTASPANQSAYSSQVIISNTTLNSLDVSLLQLDIPINLIYNILPDKNSISLLVGLSSGMFARESYQYNYANISNNSHSSKSFQSFYLLKTLNVAAQFTLPFKKYNLQVEPFLKVPLGGLTTQQLKFGAAGINLKFNFKP